MVVEDAADSAPRFRLQSYNGEISEAAVEGTAVRTLGTATPLTVAADDADLNPTVRVWLLGAASVDCLSHFSLQSKCVRVEEVGMRGGKSRMLLCARSEMI